MFICANILNIAYFEIKTNSMRWRTYCHEAVLAEQRINTEVHEVILYKIN